MSYAIIVLTALGLCFTGMTALSLAIDRHHRQVYGGDAPPRKRRLLRAVGTLLLALAIIPSVVLWGAGAGFVAWLGMLTIGALLAAGLLPYWPARVAPLATAAGALSLAGLAGLVWS
ncbi:MULTISPECIES: DUF3325 domain-containing protein [unclassified Duganella]|uniref:DUF3325 domain-containing protein n=1 Tax=unclassified Duganella TaxID=2636909 RepID=UPI00088D2477|nr:MULTISPECIES: DUF3325 domain-containing protein [unclassified Duganella]SDF78460.1 Protein of unknown function [Duganella sp. OV458]SDI50619.1 Protein of unknown function [Duganella sp. OV510]